MLRITGFLLAIAASSSALAAEVKVKPVSITVIDLQGKAIPNAWVRIPETEGRRMVDPATGEWAADMLYRVDGSEMQFVKGTVLDLTISAPGYRAATVMYEIRGRKNELEIRLSPMDNEPVVDDDNDPMVQWFKRTDHTD